MSTEREGLAAEIATVLVGQHFVIHDHTPPAIGEHLAISDKAAGHLAAALADVLAVRDRRVRAEALREAMAEAMRDAEDCPEGCNSRRCSQANLTTALWLSVRADRIEGADA